MKKGQVGLMSGIETQIVSNLLEYCEKTSRVWLNIQNILESKS